MEDKNRLKGLDRIYMHVSQSHIYPILLYYALSLAWVTGGYAIISISFTTAKPDFIGCKSFDNSTYDEFCSASNSCDVSEARYRFNNDWIESNVATNYNLVCENSGKIKMGKSLQMIGFFIAALMQGLVNDKFGRRMGMMVFCTGAVVIFCLNGLLQMTSFTLFIILQILSVAFANASGLTAFVYGMEISSPRYRSLLGMLSQVNFSIGFMLLTPAAIIASSSPTILYLGALIPLVIMLILPFIRESFRWQLANGLRVEGSASLKYFMSKCDKKMDETILDQLIGNGEETHQSTKMSDVFKSQVLIKISLRLAFIWIVTALTYFKLAIGESSGDMLIDNVLSGAVEIAFLIPGAFIVQQRWCKRRWFLAILFFTAAVSLSLDSLLTTMGNTKWARICRLPGRGAMTVIFTCLFVYSTEVYPTSIRATGLGFCSMSSRFGAILAPQVDSLASFGYVWLPGALISSLSFIAGVVCFTCPETVGMKVLETIDEADKHYNKKIRRNSI